MNRWRRDAVVLACAMGMALAACGGGPERGTAARTSIAPPVESTTSRPSPTTRPSTTAGRAATPATTPRPTQLRVPSAIGGYERVQGPDLSPHLQQPGVDELVFAHYGTGSTLAFVLVALVVEEGNPAAGEVLVDTVLSGLGMDIARAVNRSANGVSFKCGTLSGSQRGAVCTWRDQDILGVAVSAPPAGPADVDGVFALASEAQLAVKQ